MKRMVKSSIDTDNLEGDLMDELSSTFEDNIVMKHAKYINDEPDSYFNVERAMKELEEARMRYIYKLAKIIRHGNDID